MFFEYEVEFMFENEVETSCGITKAPTYAEAMRCLESYYGDELVAVKYLMATAEEEVYEFNCDMSQNLKDFVLVALAD